MKGEAITCARRALAISTFWFTPRRSACFPNPNTCLFDDAIPADVVFDMVYNPRETLLLKHAAEQGLTVIPGIEMLLEQAAHQFEIWTGETAPRTVMREALLIP